MELIIENHTHTKNTEIPILHKNYKLLLSKVFKDMVTLNRKINFELRITGFLMRMI